MEQEFDTLPCGLCGGDGYSPFNIIQICPECEGLGVMYCSKIDEGIKDNIQPTTEADDSFDPVPF